MNEIKSVKVGNSLMVGASIEDLRRDAAGDMHGEVNRTMKRLLSVNDTINSPVMRTAILEYMNELNRYMKRRFISTGITAPEDYARNGVVADASDYNSRKTERQTNSHSEPGQ